MAASDVPAVFHTLLCFLCAVVQRGPACVCKQRENFMFHMFRLEPRPQPHGLLWSAAGVASHVTQLLLDLVFLTFVFLKAPLQAAET